VSPNDCKNKFGFAMRTSCRDRHSHRAAPPFGALLVIGCAGSRLQKDRLSTAISCSAAKAIIWCSVSLSSLLDDALQTHHRIARREFPRKFNALRDIGQHFTEQRLNMRS